MNNDTLIPFIKCHLYAQIKSNGDCILKRYSYEQPDQFIKFKFGADSLIKVLSFINKFGKDTILTAKCVSCIYDGPIVKIINHKVSGDPIYLSFNDSKRSNQILLRFYRYLDSITLDSNSSYHADTLQINNSERLLVSKLFELEKKYVPIVIEEEIPEK